MGKSKAVVRLPMPIRLLFVLSLRRRVFSAALVGVQPLLQDFLQ
jgi:hypothetical protein